MSAKTYKCEWCETEFEQVDDCHWFCSDDCRVQSDSEWSD